MNDAILLVPEHDSIRVSVHPNHHGDAVSLAFTVAGTPYVLAVDPATAEQISTLLTTGVKSPRIGAMADQLRAAQRERG